MSFSLSNTPWAFQWLINNIFADLLDICVVIYLDNILIYSDNLQEYKAYVKEVLYHLKKNNLYASPEKCIFHQRKIEFLGYILSLEGLQINKEKIRVIWDWSTPRHIKDVQAFLGFMNFYRRFINNYFELTVLCWTAFLGNLSDNYHKSIL